MQAVLGQPLLRNTAVIYILHVFSDIYSVLFSSSSCPTQRKHISPFVDKYAGCLEDQFSDLCGI